MKLNQVIAILSGIKSDSLKTRTTIYKTSQKPELFEGISRTYQPREEEGYVYPPESKSVQVRAEDLLKQYADASQDLFNYSATQDWGNAVAKSDVVVGGTTILRDVPIAYLLFLEKQLSDIKTFVSSLPVQDISEEWSYNPTKDEYVSTTRYTTKTKKVTKPVVLYPATDKHPAQVKESSEDIVEGQWETFKITGAISKARQKELLTKIELLTRAVVFAREQANGLEVEKINVAQSVFDYLFGL